MLMCLVNNNYKEYSSVFQKKIIAQNIYFYMLLSQSNLTQFHSLVFLQKFNPLLTRFTDLLNQKENEEITNKIFNLFFFYFFVFSSLPQRERE